ncbi:2-keto-4-pentenoate hydratase/2-oxohepta-3-ene-1,7-dioic acid hydratase (catechol pathway) [Polynucleobacter meluiroseus]|uniref:2-keto-4-pentenoate hydratase/2-oxohepta-3-ene-1,7-dioic acid hydratase (Catechol pathway) n=1 Tax=Polynucleobacter meluiroseus TaxID=1938814 RepID=A0A240E3G3_9BURK|nr:fumarylacetoacetate hydrolase family protein [Polynucleobacter meluiroseus]SNX29464.1 2-keto-4-pentenoate hydratase/2-oxohepta-3-ene-1,7-dioic acid hydratase (catechol pathway) [Polynucleobacter meluiroseus]
MDTSRRDMLKLGAVASLSGVGITNASAATLERQPILVEPMTGNAGFRIANYLPKMGASSRLGLVTNDGLMVDIPAEAARLRMTLSFDPTSMISLAGSGNQGLLELAKIFKNRGKSMVSVNQVTLLSPIPKPQSNIYCVGWNYLDHFEEGLKHRADTSVKEYPKVPVFFSKGTQTMNGPFSDIPYDGSYSTMIDWEAELAVVIGKKGINISEENAFDYVFGYAAFNDTTARDVQQKRHSGQWFKGKSLDGHGPMGPWVVTSGGVNLDDTRIICRVNGVEKQNASYKQMYFKIPVIISELSRSLTLLPGDIIATGTPSGVGAGRTPQEFMKPGDVMETEITGIGIIRNRIA